MVLHYEAVGMNVALLFRDSTQGVQYSRGLEGLEGLEGLDPLANNCVARARVHFPLTLTHP